MKDAQLDTRLAGLLTANAALEKRLQQQELMAKISQSFIATDDLPVLVNRALDMVGQFMNVDKIIVAAVAGNSGFLGRRFGWFNKQRVSGLGAKGDSPFAPGDVFYDNFIVKQQPYIACGDTCARPEFDFLLKFGVQAFIMTPIYVSGSFWGMIVVDDCVSARDWESGDVELVNLISSVIAELIARNETEAELVRMSSIVDSSPLAIVYISEDHKLEYVNSGAVEITGYSREELQRNGLYSLFDQETGRRLKEEIAPEILSGKGQYFELPLLRKDGQIRVMQITGFTTGFAGNALGVIATDITEKRRMERELIEAKEQAERSSRAKGDFLSRMSHEMRTPMNAIIGMTSIAKNSDQLERKDYCLSRIESASTHLLGVINDVLDMSKIEANKFELSYTDFNLEKMLIKVANVINYRVDEKRQHFAVKVKRDVPEAIVADEQRLAQVITNLLGNAVKFTPEEGQITLHISKLAEESGLCTLRFEVRDTGIGITPEQQGRLFQSFEQADGGVARRFGGTGLGLAISKSIVELMGGHIWVESVPDQGSSFFFTIQAPRGENVRELRPAHKQNWRNVRVLAVDDDRDVREYFLSLAQSLRIQCAVAASGQEACRMVEEDPAFDLIFIDWKMPGMNGIELTKQIREHYAKHPLVIMISSAEWTQIEKEAKAAGVDRFIPKPLFSSIIAECISECLGIWQDDTSVTEAEENLDGIFRGKRILLAEDIEINREIVAALLEPTGIGIDCACDGREAYELFAANPAAYNVIFMDIHMPEVDGYESTRMIRSFDDPRARSIPIIAMTANVFREDIEACLAAGMNDHVGKPLDIKDIIAKLMQFL